jgi:hypothetical protein
MSETEPDNKLVTIEVGGAPYGTERHKLTGAEIKALANRPPGNRLFRLEHHQRVEVADDQTLHLHNGERFVTQPPVGKAS